MKPEMLRRLFRTGLALVLVGAIHTSGRAQPKPAPEPGQQPLPVALAKFDTNHNRHLEPSEKKALIRERMLQRREERAARARAVAEARKAEMASHYAKQRISPTLLEQYDRNQDGRLDPDEWARHRQDLQRRRAEQQGQSATPQSPPAQPPPAQPPPAPAAPAPQ
jgi:hypothetical protein